MGRRGRGIAFVATLAPAAVTGWAALMGLLLEGADAPCGKLCPESSPEGSTEAWYVAIPYVGVLAMFSLGRVFSASGGSRTMPTYRKALVGYALVSIVLAARTPTAWQPLRPAFVAGALSALVVASVGHLLAGRPSTTVTSAPDAAGLDAPGLGRDR